MRLSDNLRKQRIVLPTSTNVCEVCAYAAKRLRQPIGAGTTEALGGVRDHRGPGRQRDVLGTHRWTQAATAEETEQTAEQSERPWLADRDELKWYLAQHNALKDALERERQITDDQEAAELLRGAGRNVLSAVEIVLQDEVLWKRLASSTRAPLTADEIARVEGFTDAGLAGLLTGLGYREPPPLEELIGDTLTSFVEATQDPRATRPLRSVARGSLAGSWSSSPSACGASPGRPKGGCPHPWRAGSCARQTGRPMTC